MEIKETIIDIDSAFLISDIHFGVRSDSVEWLENIRDYFVNFFIPLIETKKGKKSGVFVLGDVFDNRETINIEIFNVVIEVFAKIAKIMPVWIIVGNHDMYKKTDNQINSLQILSNIPNIIIIDENCILTIKDTKTKCLMMPFTTNDNEASLILSESNSDFAFLHSNLAGLKYDNGRNIITGVQTKAYKGARIFSGHIHKRQESGKITYIGSPYHTKRSDIGNQKGIYKLDFANDKQIFYENTYSPIFQKFDIKDLLERKYEDVLRLFRNNYTDILVHKNKANYINIAKVLNILQPAEFKRIEFITVDNMEGQYDTQMFDNTETISIDDAITLKYEEMSLTPEKIKELNELNDYYNKLAYNQTEKIEL